MTTTVIGTWRTTSGVVGVGTIAVNVGMAGAGGAAALGTVRLPFKDVTGTDHAAAITAITPGQTVRLRNAAGTDGWDVAVQGVAPTSTGATITGAITVVGTTPAPPADFTLSVEGAAGDVTATVFPGGAPADIAALTALPEPTYVFKPGEYVTVAGRDMHWDATAGAWLAGPLTLGGSDVGVPNLGSSGVQFEQTTDPLIPPGDNMWFELRDPTLGRLVLTCDTGFVLRNYDLGFPEVRAVTYPNSMDDGTFDLTRFIGARAVTLDLTLKPWTGPSPNSGVFIAPEAQLRDRLLAFLVPSRRPTLVFREEGDTRVRQIELRAAQASLPVAQPYYNQMTASWAGPRGVIESHELLSERFQYTQSAQVGEAIIHNDGNMGAHWKMTLLGDIDNPLITINGKVLHLRYNASQGSRVEIDSFTRTVSIDGQPIGFKFLTDDSEWFLIPPGESLIQVEHQGNVADRYPWGDWEEKLPNTGATFPPPSGAPAVATPRSPGLPGVYPAATEDTPEPAKTKDTTWRADLDNVPPAPGAATGTTQDPWVWANEIDKNTGLPHVASTTIEWRHTWI